MADNHAQTRRPGESGDFRIVLAADRPSVRLFFDSLGGRRSNTVSTTAFDVSATAMMRTSRAVVAASVAVIDASIDSGEALDVCERLHELQPGLRTGVLFCCPHAATPRSMRPFLDAGIGSFLDLQLSPDQTLAALRAIARGEDVMRLHLNEDSSRALFGSQTAGEQLSADDLTLLRLVALGMTDQEIGAQMCLSHHTIKHRIERLRRRRHARNRIQLAAVAGQLDLLS